MPDSPPKRKHLRRLEKIHPRIKHTIFFISTCSYRRRKVLVEPFGEMIVETLREAATKTGWLVGRYVVMPDHAHFFCAPSRPEADLSAFIGVWKSLSTRKAWEAGHAGVLWQKEFVDHLLRSDEFYGEKWEYVLRNPVEEGLSPVPEGWPFQGEMNILE